MSLRNLCMSSVLAVAILSYLILSYLIWSLIIMEAHVSGEMLFLVLCVGMPSILDGVAITEDYNAYSYSLSHNLFAGE